MFVEQMMTLSVEFPSSMNAGRSQKRRISATSLVACAARDCVKFVNT